MHGPLHKRVVALAESRQLEELAQMLQREGADVLRCPLVNILDAPDEEPILDWIRDLIAGKFNLVVFLTGEGVRRLLRVADRAHLRAEWIAALLRSRTISRGPKPVQAFREIGLTPSLVARTPTTAGVIDVLRTEPIRDKTVAVQYYDESNPQLEQFLQSANARLAVVRPYVYAPAADADRVADLIARLARAEIDVLVLTSSPQIDRLYEVAAERQLESELAAGLTRTRVAAIGPVVADNLRRRDAPVHICPEQGFVMKNLIKIIRETLAAE